MSAIPRHLQRRFEQKWATRFGPTVTVSLPKNIGAKAAPVTPTGPAKAKEKPAGVKPAGLHINL
jgi:hypothetical protein